MTGCDMARIQLTEHAKEKGTYAISVTFLDEGNAPVVPSAAKWTLTNLGKAVVNSRQSGSIADLADSVVILLQGLDLQILEGEKDSGKRLVTVEWTYDSAYGSNLPGKAEIEFEVDNLLMVS
jgi:hypothetical protein